VEAGRVVILNGTSSSGKTSLARALQDRLGGWWLLFGIDTLILSMPWQRFGTADGHTIHRDGTIDIGPGWRRAHDRWRAAIGALVREGADVILDEVFLEAAEDQARWRQTFAGGSVLWVGVRCDVEVAAAREAARGDRRPNMARVQAGIVHEGVDYDLDVDTTHLSPEEAADEVVAALTPPYG
jgi:chloramphenicol 3-O phosphotransferase